MPKMKSHSGARKRFRTTGTGKVVRRRAGVRHLLEHKTAQRKRRLQATAEVSPSDSKRVRRMLGK